MVLHKIENYCLENWYTYCLCNNNLLYQLGRFYIVWIFLHIENKDTETVCLKTTLCLKIPDLN